MNIGAETEIREYKKTTGELKEGIISLGSMLNKNGYGTLYFGVKADCSHGLARGSSQFSGKGFMI
jgi:hypothetical protein